MTTRSQSKDIDAPIPFALTPEATPIPYRLPRAVSSAGPELHAVVVEFAPTFEPTLFENYYGMDYEPPPASVTRLSDARREPEQAEKQAAVG